jgi:hypothetical protein
MAFNRIINNKHTTKKSIYRFLCFNANIGGEQGGTVTGLDSIGKVKFCKV